MRPMPAQESSQGPQRPERAIAGGHGARSESGYCAEELAALVEHGLLDDLVRPEQ
jgi:hypothetical protein